MDSSPNTHLTGWCNDPYRRHEHRWMTQGRPSALVGDGGIESQDPPPDGPFLVDPVLIDSDNAINRDDLKRADDPRSKNSPADDVWTKTIASIDPF